ncbi:DUF262 domain-containing protein [[Clostridium] symbiosum]|mgnify:CR=1 FL=1|jgi:hypothetical protein|uniref:DUF262 domain-containing protein n=1 Tax=Clostridium symbiosum TaxID=1512 RepID=UPI000E4F2AB2|nr:DUF262 domain-containing protein [[Clostridium] symbiosum]RGY62270.1 DUF262 domain-containing protein [[Clostridium] symbiosum]
MIGLESTIITINNLLHLNFDNNFQSFLQSKKYLLSIPDYQREYKWDKTKVKTFALDIFSKSKFLGIITTEVSDKNYLSVVDGQQRLTAIMLIFTALYNACADDGETETQIEIEDMISCQVDGRTHFRLKNESVGEYLCFVDDTDGRRKIKLQVDCSQDIYRQSKKFEDSYKIIEDTLAEVRRNNPTISLDNYKTHLLDCRILLFSQKNTENLQQGSSEEIYIDINEKSQRLDPEDIFKGHCFAICKTPNQQTQVKILLESINNYQINLKLFVDELKIINNTFCSIAKLTPQELGNHRNDLKVLTTMLTDIIDCSQNLFKLPLFYLINTYCQKPQTDKMSYHELTNFVYLYYVYMFLFSKMGGTKKREKLANDLIKKICKNEEYLLQLVREIHTYSNGLNPLIKIKNVDARKQLYCILDYLEVSSQSSPITQDSQLSIKFKLFPAEYNSEHLIINKSHTIAWQSKNGNKYEFSKQDFSNCPAWVEPNNNWANFIWIDETFNRNELQNKDIITKLLKLRGNFSLSMPPDRDTYAKKHVHIELICQHIMKTQGFSDLVRAYNFDEPRITVHEKYRTFINNYFSEESITSLSAALESKFNNILENLHSLVQ